MRKALPTDAECREADCNDAGDYLIDLRQEPSAMASFLEEHDVPWGAPPLQPAHCAVNHLAAYVARTSRSALARSKLKGHARRLQISLMPPKNVVHDAGGRVRLAALGHKTMAIKNLIRS